MVSRGFMLMREETRAFEERGSVNETKETGRTGALIIVSAIKITPSKCNIKLPSKCPPHWIAVTPSLISVVPSISFLSP
jgi:hypothetical protein